MLDPHEAGLKEKKPPFGRPDVGRSPERQWVGYQGRKAHGGAGPCGQCLIHMYFFMSATLIPKNQPSCCSVVLEITYMPQLLVRMPAVFGAPADQCLPLMSSSVTMIQRSWLAPFSSSAAMTPLRLVFIFLLYMFCLQWKSDLTEQNDL